jgi:hypothetical protein
MGLIEEVEVKAVRDDVHGGQAGVAEAHGLAGDGDEAGIAEEEREVRGGLGAAGMDLGQIGHAEGERGTGIERTHERVEGERLAGVEEEEVCGGYAVLDGARDPARVREAKS